VTEAPAHWTWRDGPVAPGPAAVVEGIKARYLAGQAGGDEE
jgi:hypothetical protein